MGGGEDGGVGGLGAEFGLDLQVMFRQKFGHFVYEEGGAEIFRFQRGDEAGGGGGVDDDGFGAVGGHAFDEAGDGGFFVGEGDFCVFFVFGEQAAGAEEQEVHGEAADLGKMFCEGEEQELGAVGVGVVADEDKEVLRGGFGCADGAGGGIEVGGAEMDVWFQEGAFGPFVPGVDADDLFAVEGILVRIGYEIFEPGLIEFWRAVVEDQAFAFAAGVVVPAGGGGFDEGEFWGFGGGGGCRKGGVVIDRGGEFGIEKV